MIRLIRAELSKLVTMRMSAGLLATAAVLSGLFASLEAFRAGNGTSQVPPLSTAAGETSVTTVTGFAMLLAAVLGAIAVTGEFRHSSVTLTYLTEPRRGRVLAAKAVAAAVPGAVFGLAGAVVATGAGLIFTVARGDGVALSVGSLAGHVAGAAVGAVLLAVIGVGLGALVRSQLATVIGIFVWAIVLESIVGGLFTSVRPYLPYTAAAGLAGGKPGGVAFGPAHGMAGTGPLPFATAALLLAVIAAAILILAVRTTVRRDIS